MKVTYSKDADVLMVTLSKKKLDDSYQKDNMIIQVASDGEPVVVEILNASQFLRQTATQLPKNMLKSIFSSSFPTPSLAQKTK